MSGAEERAMDRGEVGPVPKYNGPSKAALNGWRINTPPIERDKQNEEDEE